MKTRFIILLVTLFSLLAPGLPDSGGTVLAAVTTHKKPVNRNSSNSPDFNYPETVIKNARPVLERAMSQNDSKEAFTALLEICAAETMISADAVDKCVAEVDSVARLLSPGWSSLALMLEASIVTEYYEEDRWTYDQRNLPSTDKPERMSFWDGKMFRSKVASLVNESIEAAPDQMSLSLFTSVLTPDSNAASYLLSDFLYYKGNELLSEFRDNSPSGKVIPFKIVGHPSSDDSQTAKRKDITSLKDNRTELLRRWESTLDLESNPRRWALFINRRISDLSLTERGEWLYGEWRYLGSSSNKLLLLPYITTKNFAESLSDSETVSQGLKEFFSPKNLYKLLTDTKKEEVPSDIWSLISGEISNNKKEWEHQSVTFSIPDYVLPNHPQELVLNNSNLKEGVAVVLKIPESFPLSRTSIDGEDRTGIKLKQLERVAEIPFKSSLDIPFNETVKVTIPSLAPGRYTVVITSDGTLDKMLNQYKQLRNISFRIFDVTSIASFKLSSIGNRPEIFVVNADNSLPIAGARVTFTPIYNEKERSFTLNTNNTGSVVLNEYDSRTSLGMTVRSKGNVFYQQLYNNIQSAPWREDSTRGRILTDRAIIRPGEVFSFVSVIYDIADQSISPASNREIEFNLINASGVKADSLKLKTDKSGRCVGSFRIPQEGMLGTYTINAVITNRKLLRKNQVRVSVTNSSIRVEEYKNPTNLVVLDPTKLEGDSVIVVSGRVESYSGMPVPGARVTLNLETWSRWWWRSNIDASFSTETVTGPDGRFRVELSYAGFKGTAYATSSYNVRATSVSEGGEVAEDSGFFSLGEELVVSPLIPEKIEANEDKIRLNVKVFDAVGTPERKEVRYRLKGVTDPSFSLTGTFTSPTLEIDSSALPSGTYTADFALIETSEDWNQSVHDPQESFTVWRSDDKEAPSDKTFWVPETSVIAGDRAADVKVRFGSRHSGQKILCVVSNNNKVLSKKWVEPDGKMMSVTVPAPMDTARIYVSLISVRDFVAQTETVTVLPSIERYPLQVKTETFRDKLVSGSRESWRFHFSNGSLPVSNEVSAMALMTDRALESLAPLNWHFSPLSSLRWWNAAGFDTNYNGKVYYDYASPVASARLRSPFEGFPTEWIWDPYAGFVQRRGIMSKNEVRIRGGAMDGEVVYDCCEQVSYGAALTGAVSGVSVSMKSAADDSALYSVIEETELEEESADSGAGDVKEEKLRDSECPVAFFMPLLTSEPDGSLTVDFEVPDFNTTWNFRLIGYDKRMSAASLLLSAVSSKPVMIQASLPRFVRTGDKVVLTARAYNNSDRDLMLGGSIEIVEPSTGRTIASRDYDGVSTAPSGSRLLTFEFDVPSTTNCVIVRSRAEGDGNSDGEQSLLPVLPSSSPVIESTEFYLAPGETKFEVKIPKMKKNAAVTLMYCDNPAWYCLTALPSLIEEKGKTLTSLLYSYYGNSIALGLIRTSPVLRTGLEEMSSLSKEGKTDVLTSALGLNQSLKTVTPGSTPWINSAAAETERMRALVNLLDSAKSQSVLEKTLDDIYALRATDGGMLWYPEARESSRWCTGQTLLHFAMLNKFGYLPLNMKVHEILVGGFLFCENDILKDWKKLVKMSGDSDETLSTMLSVMTNFMYIRALFGNSPLVPKENPEFTELATRSLRLIKRDWGTMSVYDRATAAVLLNAHGEKEESEHILGSLSELAMKSDRKGMWYDNLSGGPFSPWNKLITTAQVLEAFADIRPEAPEVDKLRQWLLIQRQAENWGQMRDAAELVQAILTSGTEWTGSRDKFQIKAGSNTLLKSDEVPFYGELTLSVDPSDVSGKELKITRNGKGIAWGAVVEQYVAPMSEIRSASIPDLSIEKTIFLLRNENGAERAVALSEAGELMVGDKVRVLLTVDCGREMEYVVVNDELGACLEPADVISGVDIVDGTFLYREIRNSETRFFLNYLPKGRYQLGYDCYLTSEGTFTAGIASIQSQYAPQLTAHSAAEPLTVTRK